MKYLRNGKAALAMALVLCLTAGIAAAAPKNELLKSNGNGMVVSTQPQADKIGQDVLDQGGNAIDAAVAVGYALAVVHPQAGNIGGGGFAVIHGGWQGLRPGFPRDGARRGDS